MFNIFLFTCHFTSMYLNSSNLIGLCALRALNVGICWCTHKCVYWDRPSTVVLFLIWTNHLDEWLCDSIIKIMEQQLICMQRDRRKQLVFDSTLKEHIQHGIINALRDIFSCILIDRFWRHQKLTMYIKKDMIWPIKQYKQYIILRSICPCLR